MHNTFNKIDISSEFIVVPWRGGIKLIPPSVKAEEKWPLFVDVKTLLQSKMSTYFLTKNSEIIEINEESWGSCGFQSRKEALGCTVEAVFSAESSNKCLSHDQTVLDFTSLIIKEHQALRSDDVELRYVSLKMPFYNGQNQLMGVFGFSILENQNPLVDCLSQLARLGILSTPTQTQLSSSLHQSFIQVDSLTVREQDCLVLFAEGKSAKQTARLLGIDSRTVETHCVRLRKKFNVKTTTELVAKAIREGIIY